MLNIFRTTVACALMVLAMTGTAAAGHQDLRSPDARDAADGRGTFSAPAVTVVKVPQPSPASDGGIDWGDAGIGASALLVAVLLGGVISTTALAHRRRRVAYSSPVRLTR